jgi:uncharacterized Zn finger protein
MKFPCPLCKRKHNILINKKRKPYFRCDQCGLLMFINQSVGVDRLNSMCKKDSVDSILFG